MRVQASLEGTGGVLRALVVMEDEAAVIWRTLPADRLPYRVDRDLLGDALGHRPAHGLAGEGVYRGREIEPPFSCGHAGDVARPKPVAPARGESALYQVRPMVSRLDLLPDAAFSGRAPSGESELPHDAEHALLARGDAAFSRFAVDAPAAVAALVPMEGLDDEPFERLSLYLGVGFLPAEMLVETGFRDFHRPACLLDGADLAPMLFEEPAPRAWSWLEKARNFFSISFSRSSSSTFFLSFAISWSLLIFGEPFPGNASSPISSYSQAHLLSVESFMPSSSDRPLTVISPDGAAFAAEALNCLSYRFLLWVILNTFRS